MAYATEAQAIALRGSKLLAVVFPDGAGGIDSARLAATLDVATDCMDGYLLGRVTLPMATPPAIFVQTCVDITMYEGADTAEVMTKRIKERYDRAITYMQDIAHGKIKIKVEVDTTEANTNNSAALQTRGELSVRSDARRFRRDDLKTLF